jgi:anti-anti-sigma factor
MTLEQTAIKVYEAGRLTVVGFDGSDDRLDQLNIGQCRDELAALVKEHNCEVLAFDLTGVRLLPSGLLGLLASLRQLGVEVHLYNPSADVRDVLEITNLDRLMTIHDIEL